MNKDKITRIASIIVGLILAIVLLFFGFKILASRFGKAAVKPSDISAEAGVDTFTVNFVGQEGLDCQVIYGTSCSTADLSLFAPFVQEETTQEGTKYSATATLLAKSTDYCYKVQCGDQLIDNSGTGFSITTKAVADTQPAGITPGAALPTVAPTAAVAAITPAELVTDCDGVILPKLNNPYTALQYSQCKNRVAAVAALSPTVAVTPTPTP